MQHRVFLKLSLCVLIAASGAVSPCVGDVGSPVETETREELQSDVTRLRAAGEYEAALPLARQVAGLEGRTWQTADGRRAVSLLERIVAMDETVRGRLAEADRLEAEQLDHAQRCRPGEAFVVAQRRVAIYREHLGPRDPELVPTLNAAASYAVVEQISEAENLLNESLSIAEESVGREHPLVAEALMWLSDLRFRATEYGEAERLAEEALALRRRLLGPEHAEIVNSLRVLAKTRNMMREVQEGAPVAREALAMSRIVNGELHEDTVLAAWTLAKTLTLSGYYSEAEPLFRESLRVLRELPESCDSPKPDILMDLAQMYYHQGDLEDARETLLEVKAIREAAGAVDHSLVNNLAVLSHILGDHEQAAIDFRRAMELTSNSPDSHGYLILQCNLARSLTSLGKFDEAQRLLDEVLKTALESGADGMTRVISTARGYLSVLYGLRGDHVAEESIRLESLATLRATVGDVHADTIEGHAKIGEARVGKGDLAGALEAFTTAANLFEQARRNAGTDMRAATFETTPYEQLALVRLEMQPGDAAWNDVEHARGRLLADVLLPGSDPLSLERVQAALPERAAIVGWLDHELRPGQPRSWAYVIRRKGPVHWVRLDDAAQNSSREALRELGEQLGQVAGSALGFATLTPELKALAQRAWTDRFAPIAGHLKGADELIVVPSGIMAGVPVDAFLETAGGFLGERYSVSYAVSSSLHAWLMQSRPAEAAVRTALLVGDPVYGGDGSGVRTTDAPPDRQRTLRDAALGNDRALARLPRLRWSGREVRGVAGLVPSSTVLVRGDASASALGRLAEDDSMGGFDVIHLATHALVNNRNPQRSALVLSVGKDKEAALLTAGEIADRWKLDADLVTLSACETALGRKIFGEGIVGFAYPLMQVGARSVLLSLWKVDDEATALLMQRFYELWTVSQVGGEQARSTMSKTEALREAKQWLREREVDGHRPHEHPYFWSAFVLIGDPS